MKKLILFTNLIFFPQVKDLFAQTFDSATRAPSIGGLFLWSFTALWFLIFGLIFLVSFLGIAFWIWMLVDCAKRKFEKENDKTVWLLVVALAGWIGAIIYYIMVKRKK